MQLEVLKYVAAAIVMGLGSIAPALAEGNVGQKRWKPSVEILNLQIKLVH